METEIRDVSINGIHFTFESDAYKGSLYDTSIKVNGQYWVTITGDNIDNFINEISGVINKYRI